MLELATYRLPEESNARPVGTVSPEAKVPFDAPVDENSLIVPNTMEPTYRLPEESNARPVGKLSPRGGEGAHAFPAESI